MATRFEIEDFLAQCQDIAQSSFFLVRKPKNVRTMLELGFTKANVIQEILSLTWLDYSEGPLDSHSYTDRIWIFGKEINCKEVYIKISISHYNDPGDPIETLYCISFHFAEKPLQYPNRE